MHFRQIFHSYLDFGLHILQGKITPKYPKSWNETLFHWLTKPKRMRKYNDLKKEHSRSPNKSFGQKSSAELFRRTSSCQLKAGLNQRCVLWLECPGSAVGRTMNFGFHSWKSSVLDPLNVCDQY